MYKKRKKISNSDGCNGEGKNYQAFQQGFQQSNHLYVQREIPVPTKKEARVSKPMVKNMTAVFFIKCSKY
jgi:hypothetical protein